MSIFLKSFLSVFFVSIILSFFITNTSLANNYSLDVFADNAGYNSAAAKAPLETTIQVVINAILSLAGILFLILAVYAGIRWMTAQGNAEAVTKAKDTLQAAVIGMVVIASSYAITNFIMGKLPSTVEVADNSSENNETPTIPPPISKKIGGAGCASSAECESGECVDKKCNAVLPKCVTDGDCTVVGDKCVGAVCKSASAGTSNDCKPACVAGQYCDSVGGIDMKPAADMTPKCVPGCAKDADCVGIPGVDNNKSYCKPGFHLCEYPPNLGTPCGPSDIGQCQYNPPAGYGKSYDSVAPACSLNFSVKCWIKTGKCVDNSYCAGVCILGTNTCDNSPKAKCEKVTTNFWAGDNGWPKCFIKSEYDSCKQKSVKCISDCKAPVEECIVECKKISAQQKKFECFDKCAKKFPIKKLNSCEFGKCPNGLISCINDLTPQ